MSALRCSFCGRHEDDCARLIRCAADQNITLYSEVHNLDGEALIKQRDSINIPICICDTCIERSHQMLVESYNEELAELAAQKEAAPKAPEAAPTQE